MSDVRSVLVDATDSGASPEQLAWLACEYPEARRLVAVNPSAYPDAIPWTSAYGSAPQPVAVSEAASSSPQGQPNVPRLSAQNHGSSVPTARLSPVGAVLAAARAVAAWLTGSVTAPQSAGAAAITALDTRRRPWWPRQPEETVTVPSASSGQTCIEVLLRRADGAVSPKPATGCAP